MDVLNRRSKVGRKGGGRGFEEGAGLEVLIEEAVRKRLLEMAEDEVFQVRVLYTASSNSRSFE